jgi:hypothetical protein
MDAAIAFLLVFSTAESACPRGEAKCRSAVFRHINCPSPNGSQASNYVDSFGLRATKPQFTKKPRVSPGSVLQPICFGKAGCACAVCLALQIVLQRYYSPARVIGLARGSALRVHLVSQPVPVLGVPVSIKQLNGLDSLYSIVQMPMGIPVATFAIGPAGAANAALFAVAMLAHDDTALLQRLQDFRTRQSNAARAMTQDLT